MGNFDPSFLTALPGRLFGTISNITLIAVPLFIMMGVILEKSRVAEELLDNMARLFARLRGRAGNFGGGGRAAGGQHRHRRRHRGHHGPAVAAEHAAARLHPALATGTICATGTLGQIIPAVDCPGAARATFSPAPTSRRSCA